MNKIKSTMMLLAGLVACSVVAEEAMDKGICWEYSVSDGTACIVGFGSKQTPAMQSVRMGAKKLTIPDKIGKYRVTSIGKDSYPLTLGMGDGPKSIKIPAGVTSIGKGAFSRYGNLESIELPPKLTDIAECLFQGCKNLKSVKIPPTVKSIGSEAFVSCKGLNAITIPEGVKEIYWFAFCDCSNLASVSIPASVTNIDARAFVGCGKLPKITVAKNNRVYGNRKEKDVAGALFSEDGTTLVAWPAGSAVAAVKIPAGVSSISDFAFEGGDRITSIAIPASVTNIGDCAFANCPKLSVIYAEAGDLDRLKSVIAVHNPKQGQYVDGRSYMGGNFRGYMDKIKIEEKGRK